MVGNVLEAGFPNRPSLRPDAARMLLDESDLVGVHGGEPTTPESAMLQLLLIPVLLGAFQAQPAVTPAEHIRRIENGLLPPIRVTNRAVPGLDLREEMRQHHVPALSIAVVQDGRIDWARAYGVVADGGAAATTETRFQAASISKSITTTGALRLVEQGQLSLDAPINEALKSWQLPPGSSSAAHPVTLRGLLSHTAGTTVHGFRGYAAGEALPTLVQVLNGEKPANSPPVVVDREPGAEFRYSGGGFAIVQQAMIDAAKTPFPELLQRTVLEPLGMSHSSFEQALPEALRKEIALPVDESGQPIAGGPHLYPEMAAAGLWTTPTDLARWLIEMEQSLDGHANHVLSAASTRAMLTTVRDDYGLGVEASAYDGVIHFSHGGANAGYRAQYSADSAGHGVVIMTSSDAGGFVIGELLRAVAAEYGWSSYRQTERAAADVPWVEQRACVGEFKGKDGFAFSVTAQDETLVIHFSDGVTGAFFPADAHTYFAVRSQLQVRFDSPDAGELVFAPDDTESFARVR
jgi:CubicO group peptidase (beta-lactamase class C family)